MPGVGTLLQLQGSLTRDGVRAINKEAQRIDGIEDPDPTTRRTRYIDKKHIKVMQVVE